MLLLKFLQTWQKELDKYDFVGTILIDFSKACDCLLLDLLIGKCGAYGIDNTE